MSASAATGAIIKGRTWWTIFEVFLFFALILSHDKSVGGSPNANCDKNVVIESTEVYNYLGNVTFGAPTNFRGIWQLDLQTSTPFEFIGGWGIHVQTGTPPPPLTHATITSAEPVNLSKGELITFRFRVYWDRYSRTPVVIGLSWEGHVICASRAANDISHISENQFFD